MLTEAFTLVDDRSALFCLSSVRCAVFVELVPAWFCCDWLLPDAGGLADWVELPEGWLVWAWFDGGVVVLVCAWLGLEDAGACEVLVWLPEEGGFEVGVVPVGVALDVDEADGELVVEGDVESC